ncbi:MAG: formylglycine-generating enzyme family protein [Planctomycetes bacterium]|nr:formylglycine-generating enzyme family protein [Planctomycetota bacterium]
MKSWEWSLGPERGAWLVGIALAAGGCRTAAVQDVVVVPAGLEAVDATPGAGGYAREVRDPRTGMVFVLIEPGEFWMGSPEGEEGREDDEGPRHRVRISKPFLLGKTEVTQEQWWAVMQTEPWPAQGGGDDYPAVCVSYEDANEFCKRLSETDGVAYRLPTEAEWEYACRAGTETQYSFGDDEGRLAEYAWYSENTSGHAEPVGQKKPNPWGLHDMHGNVWEWCVDAYDKHYDERSPAADPVRTVGGGVRSLRGGSWNYSRRICRSANRSSYDPDSRYDILGFRVARTL